MANKKWDKFDEFERVIGPSWKIYVDTCSLYKAMKEGSTFWERFVSALINKGCKFDVTYGTFNEIKTHGGSSRNPELRETARQLERTLACFTSDRMNLMQIVGRPNQYHDEAIQALVRERAGKFNQVYITNDLANAWDVYNIVHNSASVERKRHRLLVYRITDKGQLVWHDQLTTLSKLSAMQVATFFDLWKNTGMEEANAFLRKAEKGDVPSSGSHLKAGSRPSSGNSPNQAPRNAPKHMADGTRPQMGVFEWQANALGLKATQGTSTLKSGDVAYGLSGQGNVRITLGERIARGGEGFVYEARVGGQPSGQYLAKIYKPSKLRKIADGSSCVLEKVAHIVSRNYGGRSCRWAKGTLGEHVMVPLFAIVNDRNEFMGYLMRKASGIPLMRLITDGSVESEFRRLHPTIRKTDLIEICQSFLTALRELHALNVIVGDLNANNLIVDLATNKVSLIDADSYQYGSTYPCEVGVEKYTAPEYLNNPAKGARSVQGDLFVTARIIFETLMLIDNPYNSKVAADPIDDMKEGRFRYTFELEGESKGRLTNREAPGEVFEIRWGQLSRRLKDNLGNTFHRDGSHWASGGRCSIEEWMRYLEQYRIEIIQSVREGDGIVSNDVFPTERRKWVTRVRCEVCGCDGQQEVNQFRNIIYPRVSPESIPDVARRYHFDCYCKRHEIVPIRCSKCGCDMGYGSRKRSDGKDYICRSCRTHVKCSKCGWDNRGRLQRWMLDERGFCLQCASTVNHPTSVSSTPTPPSKSSAADKPTIQTDGTQVTQKTTWRNLLDRLHVGIGDRI